jgi:hypothetical protein
MPSHLKKRVRDRMAKTGETWLTALRNVRAQAEAAAPVSLRPAPPQSSSPRPASAAFASGRSDEGPERVAPSLRPRARAGVACLVFATTAGEQTIALRSTNSLGRHPRSSIQLLDKLAAKEHCVLERRDGRFLLRDLGSLNGTYVNGERVSGERAITHGDEIALGATRARYDDGVGSLSFALPDVGPGVVVPLGPPDGLPPRGNGDGGSGAPAETSIALVSRHPLPLSRQPN